MRTLLLKRGVGRLSSQLRLGLAYAVKEDYRGVILIDGNNKDEPAEIIRFIQALEAGVEVVQGSRFIPGGQAINNPKYRLWAIRLFHAPLISWASRFRYTDTTNGFRAYSRNFLLDPRVHPFRKIFSGYELHYYLAIEAGRLGYPIREVPVTRTYPPTGPIPTKISFFKGNGEVLLTVLRACLGKFRPKEAQR